jgi:tetratricopeptide (TPR) repeat protein
MATRSNLHNRSNEDRCDSPVADQPSTDLYGAAYALCDAGQFRKAQPMVSRFLAANPESWRGWCVAAWASNEIGDSSVGLEFASRAISLAPEREWPTRLYSHAIGGLGRVGIALEFARKAVRLEPDKVIAWRCLAEAAANFGLSSEAEEAARRAMALGPDDQQAMYAWVAAARVIERTEGIEVVLRALERNPTSSLLLRSLAIIYCNDLRLTEAKELLERALSLHPRDRRPIRAYLAVRGALEGPSTSASISRDHFEHELRASKAEIEKRPDDFRPYINSADNALHLGRHEEAFEFARASSLRPPGEQYSWVWRLLAYAACGINQWPYAKFAIGHAQELDPLSPSRWIEVAEVSFLAGDTDCALQWAQRVLDEQSSSDHVTYAQAILARCRGDIDVASAFLTEQLDRTPFYCCGTIQLATCRAELGDLDGALAAWERGSWNDPNWACNWRPLAREAMMRAGVTVEP